MIIGPGFLIDGLGHLFAFFGFDELSIEWHQKLSSSGVDQEGFQAIIGGLIVIGNDMYCPGSEYFTVTRNGEAKGAVETGHALGA